MDKNKLNQSQSLENEKQSLDEEEREIKSLTFIESLKYRKTMTIDYFKKFKKKDGWIQLRKETIKTLNKYKLLLVIIVLCIVVGSMNPSFWTPQNWKNIFTQNIYLAVIAVGVCFVILTGGIDLSVGSLAGFCSAMTINLINKNKIDANLAIFISLLIGFFVGICQGFFIAVLKLPAFIVTLSGMLMFRGLLYFLTGSKLIQVATNSTLEYWGRAEWLGISMQIWVFLIIAIIALFVLRYTIYGRNLFATGSNENAARLSGVRTTYIIWSTYIISGFLAALAGNMIMSFTRSASPAASGLGFELQAIAAVVLGGTSLLGGKGGIIKTFIGFTVLIVIQNALFAIGYDMNIQQIFSGLIVLLSVTLEKDYNFIQNIRILFIKTKNKFKK